MFTQTPHALRAGQRFAKKPLAAWGGLPDPRPLTEYDVLYEELEGHSRITVTLAQPCIIRAPEWGFIDCADGSSIAAEKTKFIGNETIVFDFTGIIPTSIALVDVPYQDMQVQNFQGGFVRPGGKWFRKPE